MVELERGGDLGQRFAVRRRRRAGREDQRQTPRPLEGVAGEGAQILPFGVEFADDLQRRGGVAAAERVDVVVHGLGGHESQRGPDRLARDLPFGQGARLVERGEAVAHRAVGRDDQEVERLVVDFDPFLPRDRGEVAADLGRGGAAEGEVERARFDRLRDLVRLGGAEEEDAPRRRLFEDLEQPVPRGLRELVRFVEDEDAVAGVGRRVLGRVPQLADVVDPGVGRGVELQHVELAPLGDAAALWALVAAVGGGPLLAVERLGEDPRDRRLADAAGARKDVRGGDVAARRGRAERLDRRLLAEDFGEPLRAVGSGERQLRHAPPRPGSPGGRPRAPRDRWGSEILRRTRRSAYRCSLPGLTGFTGPDRAGASPARSCNATPRRAAPRRSSA